VIQAFSRSIGPAGAAFIAMLTFPGFQKSYPKNSHRSGARHLAGGRSLAWLQRLIA
jgi:hypothetical protein